ncbi:2-dehydro-3-deoxyphosphogluconate aldolase/(4S)-4-hydroxy-2-oxoglutarate aldolase [Alicyclobacillus sacchari]|uniref:2-dehydro-3-deoxyphosphogluconate aldolase/(4S)-4-hydroxy-2-oxoglutarate aldolase n=2 Tax=Alicyclobacillus sacchari TaxID=392010 RepID=A0A4R8LQF5_9BACL|nr:bifunctional 4-hydroxy-2-oxoglutarate aldolase/2-dehydro-3-deoxy-phosphogluconate aldolase [Alicyclobacillus sacchari]TDY46693.1 2-dehydro-3-deoxyphosphogluconate aldolase/(4S)-4-hydroxy-2-oxoglutarate aldolase [Alicyclobacillus sacchari]
MSHAQGEGFWQAIFKTGVIAIVRGVPAAKMLDVGQALYAGGVRVMEVTLNTPDALRSIAALCRHFDGRMQVGAGTVLSANEARKAMALGASFLVAPDVDPAVIRAGLDVGVPVLPGAFTPSEIWVAYRTGAPMVKLFPATRGGPAYLRQVQVVAPRLPLVAVGGVTLANVADFFAAGAAAVGLGSALVDRDAVKQGEFSAITDRAKAFVDVYKGSRTS